MNITSKMINFVNKNKSRIMIFGDGFSLDMFDPNQINLSNDIIITCNNAIKKVPKSDFHIIYNLDTVFRQDNLSYLGLNTVLICPYRVSNRINDNGCIKFDSSALIDFLSYEPNFVMPYIDRYSSNDVINEPSEISKRICLKNHYFAAVGSGPLAFCLAMHINNMVPGIEEICYVGFDFVKHKSGKLIFNFNEVKDHWLYEVSNKDYFDYQLALVTLLCCIDNNFYSKIKSMSGLNIEDDFYYDYKKSIGEEFIKTMDKNVLTISQMDAFYNFVKEGYLKSIESHYDSCMEDVILNNLANMDNFMRNGYHPKRIERNQHFPSPYIYSDIKIKESE